MGREVFSGDLVTLQEMLTRIAPYDKEGKTYKLVIEEDPEKEKEKEKSKEPKSEGKEESKGSEEKKEPEKKKDSEPRKAEEDKEDKESEGTPSVVGSGEESEAEEEEDVEGIAVEEKPMEEDSTYFSRRLKAVLKDNAVHRPSRNKLYGDLSHKSLYKIATTSKIFERKQLDGKKDYYIGLIVDCSGSMNGGEGKYRKVDMAAYSARTLIKDFQAIAKICVTTFNRKNKLVKKFNEKFDEKRLDQVSHDIYRDSGSGDAGDNYDVDALRFMFEQMKPIYMGTRAIIIISDGEPQYRGGDGPVTFRETVKMIEKHGIPVLSIGLVNSGVRNYYTTYQIVKSIPSLYDAIINLIQKYVIRRSGV